MSTSTEQGKIIEALASEHGAVKVLPLRGTDAVLACGWSECAWNTCLLHGHYVARGRDQALRDCPSCRPGDDAVQVSDPDGEPRGKWWYVPADPATAPSSAHEDAVALRYAYETEIADAREQAAVRELLSAAGLRP